MRKALNINPRAASMEDVKLGNKIRAFRIAAHVSQADLGNKLTPPVSFQQIQKYEKGVNRVSYIKLQQICKALDCTMADMNSDLKGDGQTSAQSTQMLALLGDGATFRMVKAFALLPRDMQFKLVSLVEGVAAHAPQA